MDTTATPYCVSLTRNILKLAKKDWVSVRIYLARWRSKMKESEKPRTRYKVGKRLFDTRAEARHYKKAVCLEQKKDDCTLDE
jgi:hypothetical protein